MVREVKTEKEVKEVREVVEVGWVTRAEQVVLLERRTQYLPFLPDPPFLPC